MSVEKEYKPKFFVIEAVPPLAERVQSEKETRAARIERLDGIVRELFPDNEVLRKKIRQSYEVPQWGKYHNEGIYMDTHLNAMLFILEQAYQGEFSEGLDESAKSLFENVITAENKKSLQQYVFLHDIAKADCLRLKTEEGDKDVKWREWQEMLPDDLRENPDPVKMADFLRENGIDSISYYHAEGGRMVRHGARGAEQIQEMAGDNDLDNDLMIPAIANHEIAFQFNNSKAVNYEKHLGGYTQEEVAWIIFASYLDQMASFQVGNPTSERAKPNLDALRVLLKAKQNFENIRAIKEHLMKDVEVKQWLESGDLNLKSIDQDIAKLMKIENPPNLDQKISELKDKYRPKLISGREIGKLIGFLKSLGIQGVEFNQLRQLLINLPKGVDSENINKRLDEISELDDSLKSKITAWLQDNVL